MDYNVGRWSSDHNKFSNTDSVNSQGCCMSLSSSLPQTVLNLQTSQFLSDWSPNWYRNIAWNKIALAPSIGLAVRHESSYIRETFLIPACCSWLVVLSVIDNSHGVKITGFAATLHTRPGTTNSCTSALIFPKCFIYLSKYASTV